MNQWSCPWQKAPGIEGGDSVLRSISSSPSSRCFLSNLKPGTWISVSSYFSICSSSKNFPEDGSRAIQPVPLGKLWISETLEVCTIWAGPNHGPTRPGELPVEPCPVLQSEEFSGPGSVSAPFLLAQKNAGGPLTRKSTGKRRLEKHWRKLGQQKFDPTNNPKCLWWTQLSS